MRPFFQAGLVVSDLERAMDELGSALELRWSKPENRELGPWRFRVVLSLDGPPYVELIEGVDGSPWDAGGGSRLDHLAWWSEDMAGDVERIRSNNAGPDVDGREHGAYFTYLRAPESGLRIELVDANGGRSSSSGGA